MILAFFNYHLKWTVQIVFGSWVTSGVYVVKCVGAKIKNTHFQLFQIFLPWIQCECCKEWNISNNPWYLSCILFSKFSQFVSSVLMSSTFSFKFVTYISNSLSVLPRPKGGLHSISRAPFKAEKENTGCHRKKGHSVAQRVPRHCDPGFRPEMCSGPLRK